MAILSTYCSDQTYTRRGGVVEFHVRDGGGNKHKDTPCRLAARFEPGVGIKSR